MPVEVHTEPLKRRYTTSYLSVGCGINLLLVLGALVFPLYLAYVTRLWLVAVVRYEQLALAYQSSLLVQVQGLKGSYTGYRAPFTATWSTSPAANDLVGSSNLRGMVVRSSFQDTNYDSVGDIFKVTVSVPLNGDETVHSATVVAYFNAALSSSASLSMDGLVSASFTSPIPGQRLVLDGDVTLHQRSPIPRATSGTVYKPYLNSPLTPLANALSSTAVSPEGILGEIAARNYTLAYAYSHPPIWVPDASIPTAPITPDVNTLRTTQRSFQLTFTARVPVGQVVVAPSIPEELKHGWTQYATLLAVTITVAWYIRRVIFGYGIVETTVLVDAPRSLVKLHSS